MAWGKSDTETLSSGQNDHVTTLTTSSTFMVYITHIIHSSDVNSWFKMDEDGSSNFAIRYNTNGAGEATSVSQTNGCGLFYSSSSGTSAGGFGISYICNISSEEKLCITFGMNSSAAGAGTAPTRRESVGKHAQTSSLITSLDIANTTANNMLTDSNFTVLGTD